MDPKLWIDICLYEFLCIYPGDVMLIDYLYLFPSDMTLKICNKCLFLKLVVSIISAMH